MSLDNLAVTLPRMDERRDREDEGQTQGSESRPPRRPPGVTAIYTESSRDMRIEDVKINGMDSGLVLVDSEASISNVTVTNTTAPIILRGESQLTGSGFTARSEGRAEGSSRTESDTETDDSERRQRSTGCRRRIWNIPWPPDKE